MKVMGLGLAILLVGSAAAFAAEQDWRNTIEAALTRKATYDFKNVALGDITSTIAQDAEVNIVLDSPAHGVDPTLKMTLRFRDMSRASILTWVTRLAGLEWCTQKEAVFVTPYRELSEAAKLEIERRNGEKRVTSASWLPPLQKALDQKVTVRFAQKPLADCVASLETLLAVNIVLSPRADTGAPIALDVSKMTAENAVSWLAQKAGLDYAILDEAIYLAPPDEIRAIRSAGLDLSQAGRTHDLVSFDFVDRPVSEAFAELEKKTGVKIVLKTDVEPLPKISLSARNMPLAAAIRAIAASTTLNSIIVPEGSTIRVTLLKHAPAPSAAPLPEPAPAVEAPAAPSAAPPAVPEERPAPRGTSTESAPSSAPRAGSTGSALQEPTARPGVPK